MNEVYFFIHILAVVSFILAALKLGKETLIACFALQVILANLFVTKQMICFGMNVTCSEVYTVGAIFSLNLLQEFFGKESAQKTIKVVFFLLFFFMAMAQFQLAYIPSAFDAMHPAFLAILSHTPRIMAASFCVSFLTQKVDVELFGLAKRYFPGQRLLIRFGGSAMLSQLFDTALFTFAGLYGIVDNLFEIMVVSYCIKMIVIFAVAPFSSLTKKLVTHAVV